jgi:hypothetical protein
VSKLNKQLVPITTFPNTNIMPFMDIKVKVKVKVMVEVEAKVEALTVQIFREVEGWGLLSIHLDHHRRI